MVGSYKQECCCYNDHQQHTIYESAKEKTRSSSGSVDPCCSKSLTNAKTPLMEAALEPMERLRAVSLTRMPGKFFNLRYSTLISRSEKVASAFMSEARTALTKLCTVSAWTAALCVDEREKIRW